MIKVKIKNHKQCEFPKGIKLLDIYKQLNLSGTLQPLAAKIDNKVYDLHKRVDKSCQIEFLDLSTRDGQLVYQRSLSFLLIRAVQDLFPALTVSINYSLSKGLYCTIHKGKFGTNDEPLSLTESDLQRIKNRMQELVAADIPFIRVDMNREKAIRFFQRQGQPRKAELLQFQTAKTVSVYKCGDLYDHFYGILAPSTGYLKNFDLYPYSPGFILRFPTMDAPDRLPEFQEQRKMFLVYQEYEEWGKLLGVRTAADLNRVIQEGRIKELILTAEALHEKRIAQIADMINDRKQCRVVLISGPSSSGKTTFSRRLQVQLQVVGRRCLTIHLDDYFVDREHTPRTSSGELDFEAFEAINIKRFQRDLSKLLAGETVQLPRYNFVTGKAEKGHKYKIDKNTIVLVEGIHGLNARLTPAIPEAMKFKIYVSALTQLNLDEHNRISTSDVRVLRRLIRDHQYRGYSPVETISRWPLVRQGEEQHIFPYQESADVMFNSALIYELGVLRTFSEPWLKMVPRSEDVYSEARRLLKFTSYFLPIAEDCVLPTSILREFIGKSCFEELRYWELGK